jgi:hypothetical protein
VLGLAPEVVVCTAMGATVRSPPPYGGAPPRFSREERKWGAGLGWHRHPLFGATAACPVTTASHWIRSLGGTATPRAMPSPPCLVPSQKVQLCSNDSIWLGGYK